MPENISWTLNVQVVGGPKVAAFDTLVVDAYDKIEAVIPAGGSAIDVKVQPDGGAQLLLLTASRYKDLTYEVDASGITVTLDGPHLLIGAGAVSLLGPNQKQFAFTNSSGADITVSILVGRDATP